MRAARVIFPVLFFGFVALSGLTTADAATLWYDFTIDGDDLMSYQTANGNDGSTAVENGLYEGARLKRDGTNPEGTEAYRSYWASQNGGFTTWAGATDDRFADFNLWGYDGNGLGWGEYFKVKQWGGIPTSDGDWEGNINDWPWGTPPENNDGRLLGWTANTWGDCLSFGVTDQPTFSFRLGLDSEDMFYPGGGWHNDVEGQLVFWFGGTMLDYDETADEYAWTDMYEGNIILQGTPVPEPSLAILLGVGVAAVGVYRRFRKH